MLKATILGNLGSDPDMRYSANGNALLRFNVAANYRTRTPEGEYQDRTEWVRVAVTGKRAETLGQYLKKGTKVYVEGKLEARPWTDRDGQIRPGLEILANEIEFFNAHGPDIDMDDLPARVSVADERRMPEGVAVHGARPGRGTAAVADRDSDLEDLPF